MRRLWTDRLCTAPSDFNGAVGNWMILKLRGSVFMTRPMLDRTQG